MLDVWARSIAYSRCICIAEEFCLCYCSIRRNLFAFFSTQKHFHPFMFCRLDQSSATRFQEDEAEAENKLKGKA